MKSKVLLIDDSVTIHRVIDLSIDFDRYDIVKVFSKEDAELKIQSEQFDYILLDNKLDNIVISDYIAELRQKQKSATIILLVGAFDRFDETDLEKTKADDFLVKPFDSQSLNEKLSSDADMMPAGIVERIAEADFARDNDDYIKNNATAENHESGEGITKEEYLENLEEVSLDDLTDKGYVEDFDQTEEKAEKQNNISVEEPAPAATVVEDTHADAEENTESKVDDSALTAVNNMVSLNDLEEDEDNEDDGSHRAEDDMPLSSIELDEPLQISKSNDLLESENAPEESASPVIEDTKQAEEAPVLDFGALEENNNDIELPLIEENDTPIPPVVETQEAGEINAPATEVPQAADDSIEIPDPMQAVHSPILPDIDDAADISDDYLMQENLAPVDNGGHEMLNEFPDFPDEDEAETGNNDEAVLPVVEDEAPDTNILSSAPETQDDILPTIDATAEEHTDEAPVLPEIEDEVKVDAVSDNEEAVEESEPMSFNFFEDEPAVEEAVKEEELKDASENMEPIVIPDDETTAESADTEATGNNEATAVPLFEDDDWLSDAPKTSIDENADIAPAVSDEETVETNDVNTDENISSVVDEPVTEESVVTEEVTTQEEETIPLFDNLDSDDNSGENIIDEKIESDEVSADEPLSFDFGESEPALMDNEPALVEDTAENENVGIDIPITSEEDTETHANDAVDEPVFNMAEESEATEANVETEEDNASIEPLEDENNQEQIAVSNIEESAPAPKVDIASPEVKPAETYREDNNGGRFGGITVTISRDEIMSMLGNAIDKYFLEEAVKEVIAANMKDIVRNIVPAIAEKYIKEEIERLKNDE